MHPRFPDAGACTACAVRLWAEVESRYAAASYNGSGGPGSTHSVGGDLPVVLTAATSVNYLRGDYQHRAARWTGSFAEAVAVATGASALTVTGPATGPFRDSPEPALCDQLRLVNPDTALVMDVLGMRDRQVDVGIGLGPSPTPVTTAVATRLERGFAARGVRVGVGVPFPALNPVTVTHHCQRELGLPAIQVALAAWLRAPGSSPSMAKLALDVVREALTEAL